MTHTVWDLDTMKKVQSCEHIARCHPLMLEPTIETGRDNLAWYITDHLGVYIDTRDTRTQTSPLEPDGQIETRTTWRPDTQATRLDGGPWDGHIMTIPGLKQLRVPVKRPSDLPEHSPTPNNTITIADYTLTGWDQAARCWVFSPF